MKRIITILLATVMLFGFAACGEKTNKIPYGNQNFNTYLLSLNPNFEELKVSDSKFSRDIKLTWNDDEKYNDILKYISNHAEEFKLDGSNAPGDSHYESATPKTVVNVLLVKNGVVAYHIKKMTTTNEDCYMEYIAK